MAKISEVNLIRMKILALYNAGGQVHINMIQSHPKRNLKNISVQIKGVYPHLFLIEELTNGTPITYTVPYTDVLIRQVEILELDTV